MCIPRRLTFPLGVGSHAEGPALKGSFLFLGAFKDCSENHSGGYGALVFSLFNDIAIVGDTPLDWAAQSMSSDVSLALRDDFRFYATPFWIGGKVYVFLGSARPFFPRFGGAVPIQKSRRRFTCSIGRRGVGLGRAWVSLGWVFGLFQGWFSAGLGCCTAPRLA